MENVQENKSTESEVKTYNVIGYKMAWLEKQVAKMNRRCKKLSLPEIKINVIREYYVDYFVEMVKEKKHFYEVSVEGVSPVIAGWKFLAKLEHTEAGNIISSMSNSEELDPSYRNIPSQCQHCNTKRSRKFTYAVRHTETNELKQVGHSCLKDFVGHTSVETLAFLATIQETLEACGEDDNVGLRRSAGRFTELMTVLATTVAVCEKYTYQGNNEFGYRTTKNRVFGMIWPSSDDDRDEVKNISITEDHYKAAQILVDFVKNHNDNSQYWSNLKVVTSKEVVKSHDIGLIVSVYPAWHKATQKELWRKKDSAEKAKSEYQGTVGKREVFQVTVTNHFKYENDFGMTHIYSMTDKNGNQFVWKSSNDVLDVQGEYMLKGTVKEHKMYRDYKQTALTRCKVEKIVRGSFWDNEKNVLVTIGEPIIAKEGLHEQR